MYTTGGEVTACHYLTVNSSQYRTFCHRKCNPLYRKEQNALWGMFILCHSAAVFQCNGSTPCSLKSSVSVVWKTQKYILLHLRKINKKFQKHSLRHK